MIKIDKYFEQFPEVNEFYVTSDDNVFTEMHYAENHVHLNKLTMEIVTRPITNIEEKIEEKKIKKNK